MRKFINLVLIAVVFFTFGCAVKYVKKPAVDVVKKIAIISIYANSGLYKIGGGGGGLATLTSMVGKKEREKKKESFGGTALVEYALNAYAQELNSIEGWVVVSPKKIIESSAYKKFLDKVKKRFGSVSGAINFIGNVAYAYPPGMALFPFRGTPPGGITKELKELCQELEVDAVAVMELDVGYSADFALGGTGTAVASVSSSVKFITKTGEVAVITEDTAKDSGRRFSSNDSTLMASGEILFNEKTEEMFKDAIKQNVAYYISRFKRELAEKN